MKTHSACRAMTPSIRGTGNVQHGMRAHGMVRVSACQDALNLFSHLVQWNTIVMLSIEGSNLSVGYGKAGRVKLQQAAASAPGATAARAKSAQMQPVAERAIERSKRMADLNQEFSPCCQKARRAAEGGRSKQGLFEPHSRCSSDALAGKLQVE